MAQQRKGRGRQPSAAVAKAKAAAKAQEATTDPLERTYPAGYPDPSVTATVAADRRAELELEEEAERQVDEELAGAPPPSTPLFDFAGALDLNGDGSAWEALGLTELGQLGPYGLANAAYAARRVHPQPVVTITSAAARAQEARGAGEGDLVIVATADGQGGKVAELLRELLGLAADLDQGLDRELEAQPEED